MWSIWSLKEKNLRITGEACLRAGWRHSSKYQSLSSQRQLILILLVTSQASLGPRHCYCPDKFSLKQNKYLWASNNLSSRWVTSLLLSRSIVVHWRYIEWWNTVSSEKKSFCDIPGVKIKYAMKVNKIKSVRQPSHFTEYSRVTDGVIMEKSYISINLLIHRSPL